MTTGEAAPTSARERVALLDVMRGFALLGVLAVNMQYFVEPSYAELMGEAPGLADRVGVWLVELFAYSKFYPIFSFLFGYGAALQMASAARRGDRFVSLYAWRMALLLLIGAYHAVYVWSGDILATYALLGFVLLLFRGASDRSLLAWSIGLALAATLLLASLRLWLDGAPAPAAEAFEARFAELTEPYRRVGRQTLRVMSMFVLGFWAGRRGLVRDEAPRDPDRLRRVALGCLAAGLAGNVGYVALLESADPRVLSWSWVGAVALLAVSGLVLAAGYLAQLARLFQRRAWRARLAPLGPVGRMALTNYLLQSFACLALVGEHGLARFVGPVHPPVGVALTFAIFAAQVAVSGWWLRRFRFGPVEWLWRSATYAKRQPFRA